MQAGGEAEKRAEARFPALPGWATFGDGPPGLNLRSVVRIGRPGDPQLMNGAPGAWVDVRGSVAPTALGGGGWPGSQPFRAGLRLVLALRA